MKRIFYLFAAFVSSATALSAATDDIYSQCISAKFDSPADAQKSAAEILPYPDGRKIAFSTRWDDTNPRHLATAQMLSKRGMFATCYLVGYGFQNPETLAMVRGVLELGGAIGSHTLTHPHLENFIPNEFFGEIALERAHLEAAFDANVVGFVLPYMSYNSRFDDNVKNLIGRSIVNAGYRVSPETNPDNNKKYGLSERDGIYSSYTFGVDDRNPQRGRLIDGVKKARAAIEKGYPPHFTLGIHSWQTDEGLERLGTYLDEVKSDDFWYCNENDFVAYRTQFLKGKIRKTVAQGDTALYELYRVAAMHIGSDIPLAIRFSIQPKSVRLGDTEIKPVNGIYNIPQYDSRKTPKKIDMLSFGSERGKTLSSAKFAGLDFGFDFDRAGGKLTVKFGGQARPKITNFRARWVLPPCYKTPLDGVAYKGESEVSAKLVPVSESELAAFDGGDMRVLAQCDFLFDGVPARVWLAASDSRPVADADCPRDRVLQSGDFDASKNDPAAFAELSKPDVPLKPFADCVWKISPNKKLREFVVDFNGYALMGKYGKAKMSYLVCADFAAPRDGKFKLYAPSSAVAEIYVNGAKQGKLRGGFVNVDLKKGDNRVLLVFGNKALRVNSFVFAVCDGKKMLPCKTPKIEK